MAFNSLDYIVNYIAIIIMTVLLDVFMLKSVFYFLYCLINSFCFKDQAIQDVIHFIYKICTQIRLIIKTDLQNQLGYLELRWDLLS